MKYVAIAAIVLLMVRVDFILDLAERAYDKMANRGPEIEVNETKTSREIISVKDDQILKRTTRQNFLALLDDYNISPGPELRARAINLLRANPSTFGVKLDRDLEARIFGWRDLLINNRPELVKMLLDLGTLLQGENLDLLNRFFALWMDIQMENFIAAYVQTKDVNCAIAPVFGDTIPEDEKLFEYYDREEALKAFLAKEKIDPAQKQLATNCLLQLSLVIQKIAPKASTTGEATPAEGNQESTATESVPVVVPVTPEGSP